MARKNTTVWVRRMARHSGTVYMSRGEPTWSGIGWASGNRWGWVGVSGWRSLFDTPEPPADNHCYQCDIHDLIDGIVVWREEDA